MKVTKLTLLTVLGVCSLSVAAAFVPSSGSCTQGLTFCPRSVRASDVPLPSSASRRGESSSLVRNMSPSDSDDGLDELEEEEDGPLSKGIESVSWLPTVFGKKSEIISGVKTGNEILPLFPLGGIVYTPNSEHVLNIFEPRYRAMYNDILMNGTKRFVVSMSHPTEQGRFAQMGVLFELEDLKEVSEQTNDQVKYVCNHRVTGRVKLDRVINPEAWESRETYLKVEGMVIDDTGKKNAEVPDNDVYTVVAAASELAQKEEDALRETFAEMVKLQHELEEDVRFTLASVATLAVGPGAGPGGLWQTIQLWQNFAEQRLVNRQNELQREFQDKLIEYLKKDKGVKDEELPSVIGFDDLSAELQEEVQELQRRMSVELKPLVIESTLTMQKILEAEGHKERCNLLVFFMDAERKRLKAKKTLQGVLGGSPAFISSEPSLDSVIKDPVTEKEEKKEETEVTPQPRSIFTDEPDAFQ